MSDVGDWVEVSIKDGNGNATVRRLEYYPGLSGSRPSVLLAQAISACLEDHLDKRSPLWGVVCDLVGVLDSRLRREVANEDAAIRKSVAALIAAGRDMHIVRDESFERVRRSRAI